MGVKKQREQNLTLTEKIAAFEALSEENQALNEQLKTLKQSITDDTTEEEMKSLRLEYESLEKKFSIVQSENANLIDMTETLRKEINEMKNDNDELKEKEK